jgi:hypothetical protein
MANELGLRRFAPAGCLASGSFKAVFLPVLPDFCAARTTRWGVGPVAFRIRTTAPPELAAEEAMRVVFDNLNGRRMAPSPILAVCALGLSLFVACARCSAVEGMTPESPEVQKVVNQALTYLDSHSDERLGGKCLIALAFVKAGRGDHAHVKKAIEACGKMVKDNPGEDGLDMYSNGLAIIFLCEVSSERHRNEINWFLDRLKKRQKGHGGWGYPGVADGDTSQSQYGALSYWEANRRGFTLDGTSVENFANWLLKTQDPGGCWGYQGKAAPGDTLIAQDETNCSMLAAGLGSLYICADLFGMKPKMSTAIDPTPEEVLPSALKRVDESGGTGGPKQYKPAKTSESKVLATMGRAHAWMEKNYQVDIGLKCYYYLYGLERYKSFQEAFEGSDDKSPKWYNEGYEFLAKTQAPDGSWSGYCQAECDTAFSVLFLLRSTQKSIRAKLGEGSLLAGRGLPANLKRAKLKNGELVVDQVRTKVDELLSLIDDGDEATLDDLARDPSQLIVEQVDEKSARRLQQLVRGGEPAVRLLSVRALGRTGNLDYVPTLLYALTDPDTRVVIEARNELRFISRNFNGLGPPDNFTEPQRFEAIEAWKKWYLSIRPDAVLEKK